MRLSDIKRLGEFDKKYRGGYSLIDYTLRITRDGLKSVYSANANFYINLSRGIDAASIFDGADEKGDEEYFYKKNPDIFTDGDLFY